MRPPERRGTEGECLGERNAFVLNVMGVVVISKINIFAVIRCEENNGI